MKLFLYTTTLLSFGLGAPLCAVESTTATKNVQSLPSTSTEASSSKTTLPGSEDQSQAAAWMLESGQVAKDYVDGLDREMYAESWGKGDQLFQHTITKEEWTKALNDSRKPLGKVTSRTIKDQRSAKDPKGLPKGVYMVVEYNTSFENAPDSGELLTLRRGSDGKWRVLTYQVN